MRLISCTAVFFAWVVFIAGYGTSYKVENDKDAVSYLTYFGYVDPDKMPLGFSLRDCNLKLKEFQKLARVEVTGKLDADTLKAMNTPRCGCPDFIEMSFKNHEIGNESQRKSSRQGRHHHVHHHHHHHHNHHHHHHEHNESHDLTIWPRSSYFGKDYHIPVSRNNTTLPHPEEFTISDLKWWKETVSYNIVEYPSRYNIKISTTDIEEAIHKAFKMWEQHINLQFVYEPNNIEVDIEVKFVSAYHGDNYPFDGPGKTLAHAFFPGSGVGGDVHFEQEEDWTKGTYNGVDILYVAVHEIGHSLGLGHSAEYGSIMYPMYRGYHPNLQLHSDDITGIQALYGPRKTTTNRPPRPTHKPRPTPKSTTTPIPRPEIPGNDGDICDFENYGIDGITTIFGDAIMVFKGKYVYKIGSNGEGVQPGWPKQISEYFRGLDGDIDAVMTRTNGKTYFFKDTKYWRFTGTKMDRGYPRSILEYFPGIPTNVDAAFEWDEEFVFSKGMNFWSFNHKTRPQVPYYFPMHLSHWGLTEKLDGAFTAPNGTVYFFQNDVYMEFDKNAHRVKSDNGIPALTNGRWFGCWDEP